MSCRMLAQTQRLAVSAIMCPHSRPLHLTSSQMGVLDYFRKKTPQEVAAKTEEEEEDQVQLFSLEEEPAPALTEEQIYQKRNKSRLAPYHQRLANGEMPHPEPVFWTHHTVKYKQRMFGTYGETSGVNPGIMWPTRKELQERIKYESVCNPLTIQEMVNKRRVFREAERQAFEQREREIDEKMKMLDKFKDDLFKKQEAKEKEQHEAKMRREKLMEEVRRHFGYTVDTRDERFQELLAQKEKEQKKKMKEARKLAKEQKQLEKLEAKTSSTKSQETTAKSNVTDDD